MTDHAHLQAAAQRALEALGDLILNSRDPGVEALGAQYELRQALLGTTPEIPTRREWQIQSLRHSGIWTGWSVPTDDAEHARRDYAETVATHGQQRAHRLICGTTTHVIEAHDEPDPDDSDDDTA
ncbi:hypothetical protein ACFYQQ_01025 [Streptomyces sp. NPDC005496]|uniref:hypothetical protein n=1 Tax=unclassified Streptomyces TaxID=2593676 RepID=UPI0033BB7BE2